MNRVLLLAAASIMLYGAPKVKIEPGTMEDTYALAAMDAQMRQKSTLASSYFDTLYSKTGKKEYLYHSLRMYEQSNDLDNLKKATRAALAKMPDDQILKRFEIIGMLKEGKFSEAAALAQPLAETSKASPDYLLSAEALLKLGNYQGAYRYLKSSYDLTYDEETTERIALIMYAHLDQKQEAIAFLKEHIGSHGNSKLLGKRLGSLYADSGRLDEAAVVYEETYDFSNEPYMAQEAVKIYLYQQNYLKLTAILEKSGVNDPMLLELYIKEKQFLKASELAKKLYENDNNPLYLAQSSVFAYEGSDNRNDPVMLNKVVNGLKQANEQIEEPLYLNYLGYLMIDHDMGIDEGIVYVKKALAKQPDSPFYIDSLAWGYYKKGECAQALDLIHQVANMIGTDEVEVKEHLNAIEKCQSKE